MVSTVGRFGFVFAALNAMLVFSLFIVTPAKASDRFSMSVMSIFTIADRGTVLTGQVKSGSFVVGDTVCIPLKNGQTVARTVKGIEMRRKLVDRAEKGKIVGVLVQVDKKLVAKGVLLHADCELKRGGKDG